MSGADFGLAISVFLACAVEAVEALTIVIAVVDVFVAQLVWPG